MLEDLIRLKEKKAKQKGKPAPVRDWLNKHFPVNNPEAEFADLKAVNVLKRAKFKRMRLGRAIFKVNKELGFFPYFTMTLRSRIRKKRAINVAIVGEAGVSKSYTGFTIGCCVDSKFTVRQVVFKYSAYMYLVRRLRMGAPIMFDEPSYAMGKRDWYKELNKVLVQTIESQRFKVHPLLIPIINMNLLDKTIRDHLIQYVVLVLDRGRAMIYRIRPSQWEDKIYRHYICLLKMPLIGRCKRESCLSCKQLTNKDAPCIELRAQYERKKASIQEVRYQQAEAQAQLKESKEFTMNQLAEMAFPLRDRYTDSDGKINAAKLRIVLADRCKVRIGHNKTYDLKALLIYQHPSEFYDSTAD